MDIEKLTIEELIAEINKLVEIAKQRELTIEEQTNRTALRKKYIDKYRESMLAHLKTIKVVDENGQDITNEKLKELKKGS